MTTACLDSMPSHHHVVLAVVCAAALVLPLDFSGAAAATPVIGRDFGAGGAALAWVVNAFMLGFGSTLLTAGALADRYGRRRIFAAGLFAFILVSIGLCLSPDIVTLDLLRLAQGFAAAATLAGGSAALGQAFEGHARMRALSLLGTTFGVGLAFGPSVAGLLIELSGWRAIFLSGAVVGSAALAFGLSRMNESRNPGASEVDWAGAATFTLALASFTAAMLMAPDGGWASGAVLGLSAIAVVMMWIFVQVERRVAQPMLDLSLFRDLRFLGVQALPVATCLSYVVLVVLLPTRFIGIEHRRVLESGLVMLALSAPMLVVPMVAGRLSTYVSPAHLSATGLVAAAAGLLWLAQAPSGGPALQLCAPLAVIGLGAAVPWGLMDGLSFSVVPPERAGMATGIFSTVRVAGEGVAIAIARALLAALASAALAPVVGGSAGRIGASLASGDATPLGGPDSPAVMQAYAWAFGTLLDILAAAVVLSAVLVFFLLRQGPKVRSAPIRPSS